MEERPFRGEIEPARGLPVIGSVVLNFAPDGVQNLIRTDRRLPPGQTPDAKGKTTISTAPPMETMI